MRAKCWGAILWLEFQEINLNSIQMNDIIENERAILIMAESTRVLGTGTFDFTAVLCIYYGQNRDAAQKCVYNTISHRFHPFE